MANFIGKKNIKNQRFYRWKMRAKKKFPLEIFRRYISIGDSGIYSNVFSTL
jgi:hypothetical protein